MAAIHMVMPILDSQRPNSFVGPPLPDDAKNVLNIGTGDENWAISGLKTCIPSKLLFGGTQVSGGK